MSVKSSVSLTDQQAAFARGLVDEGRYSSLSAVIQQGLDMLRHETEARTAETEALKALLKERAAGPFLTADEFRARTDQRLRDLSEHHGQG